MKALLTLFAGMCIFSCTPSTAPTQSSSSFPLDPSEIFITRYFPENSNRQTVSAPEEVLAFVKNTDRISSNRYSDMVVDSRGNAYIACFEKKEDGQDYVLITKIALDGQTLWESGTALKGRATAITIDQEGNVWVLGSLEEGLPSPGNIDLEQKKPCIFMAQFSPDGACTRLISSSGSGRAFNIHINKQHEIMISGHMGSELSFGETSIENDTGDDQGFLARFDALGQCLWIKPISAAISRIKSDSKGDFYLCGSFHKELSWEKDSLSTESRYDDDGFLMKIARNEKDHWIRRFGKGGVIETGYATRETATDMFINSKNEILVCAMLDLYEEDLPEKERVRHSDMSILHYDARGTLIDQTLVAKHLSKRSSNCLTQDMQGNIWISGHAQAYTLINEQALPTEQDQQTFLLKLSRDKKIEQIMLPHHQTNMAFRAAYSLEDRVYFSGHFQTQLSINGQTIQNNGAHALFFYNKKVID